VSRYAYDIYPAANPLGSRLVRLTDQHLLRGTGWRIEYNGTGSGQIVINRWQPECTAVNFADGNHVRVVDTVLNKTVAGFFLPRGTVTLLARTEKGGQNLTIQGPGTLAYLAKCILLARAYVAPGGGPGVGDRTNSPRSDGLWHWPNNYYLAVAQRLILEAQDPDRPDDPLSALNIDWSYTTDSAGNASPQFVGDYTQPIGTNYIEVIADLIRLGETFRIKSDTFLMQAYNAGYGTDRSSATFAAGKVRFAGGINIAADLSRTLQPTARVKELLVQGKSTDPADFVLVTDSGAPDGEAFLSYGVTDDPGALAAAGAKNIALRALQTDIARFPILLGATPLSGIYAPSWPGEGGHFYLGDTVTVHTGTSELDYDEQAFRVAAIEGELLDGGNDRVWVELGATFVDFSKPTDVAGGISSRGCNCPPLCFAGKACHELDSDLADATATNGDAENGAGTEWSGGTYSTAMRHAGARGYRVAGATSATITYDFGAQVFQAGQRYVIDLWRRQTVDHDATTIRLGVPGVDDSAELYQGVPGDDPVDLWDESGTGADGQTWNRGRVCWTPLADRTGVRVSFEATSFGTSDFAVDDLRLYTAESDELAGASTSAARCDHNHFHRDLPDLATSGHPAAVVSYDNTGSGSPEDDAQDEFDRLEALIAGLGTAIISHHDLTDRDLLGEHPQYVLTTDGGQEVISVHAASGSTETLDLADGNVQDVTLTANCALSLAGAVAGVACSMAILLRQDGTGSRLATWPASVQWVGGSAPTLQTAANAWDWVGLVTLDGGVTWFGQHATSAAGASYATPAFTFGTSNAAGAATTGVRSDASIALFDTTVPVTQAFGDVAATGTAAIAARRDHVHGMPAAAGTSANDHIHIAGETLTGDGSTTSFLLAEEAIPGTVAAYVAGLRTAVTLGGANDQIIFGSAPAAAAAILVDYVPLMAA
jgi:hypothetical protein